MCIFHKKKWFFSNEEKVIIQNNYEGKNWSAYKIWKNHPLKKWDYSSVKRLLEKFTEKVVQWIENIAQGNLGMFLRKKT